MYWRRAGKQVLQLLTDVLAQVIGSDAEEVDLLRKDIADQGGCRRFDHDANLVFADNSISFIFLILSVFLYSLTDCIFSFLSVQYSL